MVLIPASVVDRKDRLVLDLKPGQLRLYEDRVEQKVARFAIEEGPVSLAILFDLSYSVRNSLPDGRAAVRNVFGTLRPDDEVCLIEFRDRPTVKLPFGTTPEQVLSELAGTKSKGGTALLDAVAYSLHYVRKSAKNARRAVLVFSDGNDRDSRYTSRELISMVRESDVRVYPFLLSGEGDDPSYPTLLMSRLAEESGGRHFVVSDREGQKLDLHWQYVIGYRPGNRERDGRYRKVELKLDSTASGRNLRIFWKHGYIAPQ
jgi:VWFA-related protein